MAAGKQAVGKRAVGKQAVGKQAVGKRGGPVDRQCAGRTFVVHGRSRLSSGSRAEQRGDSCCSRCDSRWSLAVAVAIAASF